MTQYTGAGSIGSSHLNLLYSKIGPVDSYIIMRTSDDTVGMLVYDNVTKECTEYTIEQTGSNYGSYAYQLYEQPGTWEYTVTNEYYVYSNVGYGSMQVLPVHEIMVCWGVAGLTCLAFVMLMFRGVLIRWRKR